MPIEAINSIKTSSSYKKLSKNNSVQKSLPDSYNLQPSFMGQDKLYADQISKLKSEVKLYPKDIEYRKNLLASSGKNPADYHKIRSIIGVEEIKTVMAEFNDDENFYSTGDDYENLADNKYRANLHMHTVASDGYLTTGELLDKAVVYANESAKKFPNRKEPFIVAITDHDTTESAKEAIDIIFNDPLKYKNLRVVLGIEMTTYNNIAPHIVDSPTNTHILVYGINPYEYEFSNFVDSTKNKKHAVQEKMISSANELYKNFYNTEEDLFDLGEAQELYGPLRKDIIGIYGYMDAYVQTKAAIKKVILESPELVEILKENILPTDVEGLMREVIKQEYSRTHGNQARNMHKILPELLAEKTGEDIEKINQLLEEGLKREDSYRFGSFLAKTMNEYKVTFKPKYDYLPGMKNLQNALENQDGVLVGIAHPLDTVEKIKENAEKYEFLTDLYTQFKNTFEKKAVFSEAYYQSYSGETLDLKNSEHMQQFIDQISDDLDLHKTGSYDTHRKNIFRRYTD